MMEITSEPLPNPCAEPNCHHTRRKHLHKTYENGRLQSFHYGACRMPNCRCVGFREALKEGNR